MESAAVTADQVPSGAEVLDIEERNWLPRHCRGDGEAFGKLMDAYRVLVFTFLKRYGVRPASRDDLFQEIFLKIHLGASSYRSTRPLRSWIITIVLNTVRNFRRDQFRRKQLEQHAPVLALDHEPGADQVAEGQTTLNWLESRIACLPPVQREVLTLSTLKGLRMKELAEVLQIPENTVKTHLRRARLALAEDLATRRLQEEST